MTSDNEIIALRASGVSLMRMSWPLIMIGLMLSLACIPLNYVLMPEAGYRARKLVKEIGVNNPTALLEPGVFLNIFENYVVFIYDMRGETLLNVRIYQPQPDGPTRTLVAEKGEIVANPNANSIKIKLTNGIADETDPKDPKAFYKLKFQDYHITLNLKESLRGQRIEKKPRELTLGELREELDRFKEQKLDPTPIYIEMHNKTALAFSNLIFVMIAIPIGLKTHRREKTINFGMALLVFLIYWAMMLGGVALVMRKVMPAWLGVWSPNMIFGAVSLVFLTIANKR
jgi:lipopolysaccharide export system permease protein